MITPLAELKGRHQGAWIYVIASGKSMDFYPRGMFDGQICVGVNESFRDFLCQYVVMHHHDHAQEAIDAGKTLVVSEFDCGHQRWGSRPPVGDYVVYKHVENPQTRGIDLTALDSEDRLAISACTTAEAVHFAAHLGASVIVLCGADSGRLDGELNYSGYNDGGQTDPSHIPMSEPLLLLLVNALRKRGVSVISLSPFINPGMEGHIYSRPPVGVVYVSGVIVDADGKRMASITPPPQIIDGNLVGVTGDE